MLVAELIGQRELRVAEQPVAKGETEKTDTASLFATKLGDAFKLELVEGYPTIDGAKLGAGYAEEPGPTPDKKRLRFLVKPGLIHTSRAIREPRPQRTKLLASGRQPRVEQSP